MCVCRNFCVSIHKILCTGFDLGMCIIVQVGVLVYSEYNKMFIWCIIVNYCFSVTLFAFSLTCLYQVRVRLCSNVFTWIYLYKSLAKLCVHVRTCAFVYSCTCIRFNYPHISMRVRHTRSHFL